MRSFRIDGEVRGSGFWLAVLLFMGGVGAVVTSHDPVVEPLWLHYVLLVLIPFILGFVGLSLLIGRGSETR